MSGESDPVEFILLDTNLTTRLRILPSLGGRLYLQLNDPGSGALDIPLKSDSAADVTNGRCIEVYYRGASRGTFLVENISKRHVDNSEYSGQVLSVSGRGGLSLLDDSVIWAAGTDTTRNYSGQTKASILIDLIDEAQARGGLASLTYSFSDTNDSLGAAWIDSETYKLNVGMSYLDLVRQFSQTESIDFNMTFSGGGFVLNAYKNGIGADKSSYLYFRTGTNCEEVGTDERGNDVKNALLAAYKSGNITVTDPTSIAAYRRREDLISIQAAQTASSATTYAAAKLELKKSPKKSITIKVTDLVSPHVFLDYDLGDTPKIDLEGTETAWRIYGMSLDFRDTEVVSVVLETNSIMYDKDDRMSDDIDWLLNQWNTAHDANLLEVSFWDGIGQFTYASPQYCLVRVLGDKVYVSHSQSNLSAGDVGIDAYDTTNGTWAQATTNLQSRIWGMEFVGTDLYIAHTSKLVKLDTTTNIVTVIHTFGGTLPFLYSLAVIGTNLYIAGNFDDFLSGGQSGFCVYDTVGLGFTNVIQDVVHTPFVMVSDGTNLYGSPAAAPDRDTVLYFTIGTGTWSAVGSPFASGAVLALAMRGNDLIVGGTFPDGVAIWDGATLATLDGGTAGEVYGVTTFLNDTYIVGNFTDLGNRIAKNSGGVWTPLSNALDDSAYSVAMHDEDVYVVGAFLNADSDPALNVAVYFTNFQALLNHLSNASGFDMGAAIHNATVSAVTDSDEFPFWEDTSADLRKITFANLKSSIVTQEAIEDYVGGMVTGNTETGIAVTYDDTGGKLNFDAQTAGDARYSLLSSMSAVNALDLTDGGATTLHTHAGATTVDTLVNILALTPTAGQSAFATTISGTDLRRVDKFLVADGTNWREDELPRATRIGEDMGAESDSGQNGYGVDYISDKRLANAVIGGNSRTVNGAIRVDVTQTPDTFEIYLRDAWKTIIYDFTTANGDLRHAPVSEQIYVWRGDSVLVGTNNRPIVQEYSVSMGSTPPARTIYGGTF